MKKQSSVIFIGVLTLLFSGSALAAKPPLPKMVLNISASPKFGDKENCLINIGDKSGHGYEGKEQLSLRNQCEKSVSIKGSDCKKPCDIIVIEPGKDGVILLEQSAPKKGTVNTFDFVWQSGQKKGALLLERKPVLKGAPSQKPASRCTTMAVDTPEKNGWVMFGLLGFALIIVRRQKQAHFS